MTIDSANPQVKALGQPIPRSVRSFRTGRRTPPAQVWLGDRQPAVERVPGDGPSIVRRSGTTTQLCPVAPNRVRPRQPVTLGDPDVRRGAGPQAAVHSSAPPRLHRRGAPQPGPRRVETRLPPPHRGSPASYQRFEPSNRGHPARKPGSTRTAQNDEPRPSTAAGVNRRAADSSGQMTLPGCASHCSDGCRGGPVPGDSAIPGSSSGQGLLPVL